MKLRIYHAWILTMEEKRPVFEGELHVENDRITYVGENPGREALSAEGPFDREIDAGGNLLMPGFKNAHAHSAMTFLRSYADDLPLDEWLNCQVFPMEAKLDEEKIYWLAQLAFLEYLTSGITAAFDMYLIPDAVGKAARDFGFRTVLVGAMNNFCQSPEDEERCFRLWNRPGDLVSYRLGFHAEYTTSRERMEALADLAHRFRAPVFAHNSETEKEVRECIGRYGKTPTQVMEALGLFDYGGGGYHCIWLAPEDFEIFRRRGLFAVTCPGSNAKLASGIAPVAEFLCRGIPVAVGTDGAASNNCLDMFREMFLVTGLSKLRERDASAVPAKQVLRMATVGGARAMGLKECETLTPGQKADLIMIDLHQPNMHPLSDPEKNLVYSGSKQNVCLTMVDGKILYENGRFRTAVDPELIYEKAEEILRETAAAQ
ncbi:MAG TPA: amidohydrolase [Candidatus Fusicatenibacter intestinigallinarum]|uniref:Amidohydrolase n=1 Tax=Candidatus Fusicatenibacter intestinigallinarum TaxID=2838598 RepID=A0A9D2NB99_9FIRM|nr:amidohydrolase [Candidatus Fusicatenibacter intestinigallinarum]